MTAFMQCDFSGPPRLLLLLRSRMAIVCLMPQACAAAPPRRAPELSEAESLTFGFDPQPSAPLAKELPRQPSPPNLGGAELLRHLATAWSTAAPPVAGAAAASDDGVPTDGFSSASPATPHRISDTWQLHSAIDRIWDGDTHGVADAVAHPGDEQANRGASVMPELGDVLSDVENSQVSWPCPGRGEQGHPPTTRKCA